MNTELIIRTSVFLGILVFMGLWEITAPRRQWQTPKTRRWTINLVLAGLNSLLIRVLFASSPFAAAILAREQGWGLLNNVEWPLWADGIVAVILLDLAVYLQHVLFHAIPTITPWRPVHCVQSTKHCLPRRPVPDKVE